MEQPIGYVNKNNKTRVCRLKKSIYGLKQAGRTWYQEIDGYFKTIVLHHTIADDCVYTKQNEALIVALYVDDLLIFSSDIGEIQDLKKHLHAKFDMKDLGKVTYCLGI